jgi:hypothetical protein
MGCALFPHSYFTVSGTHVVDAALWYDTTLAVASAVSTGASAAVMTPKRTNLKAMINCLANYAFLSNQFCPRALLVNGPASRQVHSCSVATQPCYGCTMREVRQSEGGITFPISRGGSTRLTFGFYDSWDSCNGSFVIPPNHNQVGKEDDVVQRYLL